MSRFAFVSFLLFLYGLSFVVAAPVPERSSSFDLVERFSAIDGYDIDLVTRYPDDDLLEERDLDNLEGYDVFQRGFGGDLEEPVVLERRTNKVKQAFEKVGHFLKTTGAKIAKFGLKVVSTAQNLASKVVRFVPGIGTALSAGMKAASMVTGKASDLIHANLGNKLNKGMKVMNTVNKIA